MDIQSLIDRAQKVQETARELVSQVDKLQSSAQQVAQAAGTEPLDPFIVGPFGLLSSLALSGIMLSGK